MNSIIKLFTFFVLLSSCSSNPTNADRTTLQKLNGLSYESTNSMGIVTELSLLRKVEGQIYCGDTISQTPARQVKINLIKDQKLIATTASDTFGYFSLLAKIPKQVTYILRFEALCGSYTAKITWSEDHIKLNDIFLKK